MPRRPPPVEYDRFGPYSMSELPYCGVVITPPMYNDPIARHVVFVDRNQKMYVMPANIERLTTDVSKISYYCELGHTLFKETVTHQRDIAKFRRDWLLDFGDGVQFGAENEDSENDFLLKTIGLFSSDLKTCWTRLFGEIPISVEQVKSGVPNVVYDCWVKVWNDDREKIVDVQTRLYKFIEVNPDERAAIWEAPWNKSHPKYPNVLPFEDEEDELALLDAHLELSQEKKLDIVPKQEGIYLGLGKKEVFAPKFSNTHVFIGLERSDARLKPGLRIEMDIFWNDALEACVVYHYDLIKNPKIKHIPALPDKAGVVRLQVELDLRKHVYGFYEHPIFGLIVDDLELLGILPTCAYAHLVQNVSVFISDTCFGRFARFSIVDLPKETKDKLIIAKSTPAENHDYQQNIDENGVVINTRGLVYCLKYPYPMFEFVLEPEWRKFKVGERIAFKSKWKDKTQRRYSINKARSIEDATNYESIAIYPYGKDYAAENQNRTCPHPESYFKFYVNPSEHHTSMLIEAGPFGLVEDPDFNMGPIRGKKPTGNRFNKIRGLWVVCGEDRNADRLTYFKVLDQVNEKTTLEAYLRSMYRRMEVYGVAAPERPSTYGLGIRRPGEFSALSQQMARNVQSMSSLSISSGSTRSDPSRFDAPTPNSGTPIQMTRETSRFDAPTPLRGTPVHAGKEASRFDAPTPSRGTPSRMGQEASRFDAPTPRDTPISIGRASRFDAPTPSRNTPISMASDRSRFDASTPSSYTSKSMASDPSRFDAPTPSRNTPISMSSGPSRYDAPTPSRNTPTSMDSDPSRYDAPSPMPKHRSRSSTYDTPTPTPSEGGSSGSTGREQDDEYMLKPRQPPKQHFEPFRQQPYGQILPNTAQGPYRSVKTGQVYSNGPKVIKPSYSDASTTRTGSVQDDFGDEANYDTKREGHRDVY